MDCKALAVRKCVRLLLLWTHTGGVWLDQKIPINAKTIHAITAHRIVGAAGGGGCH